MRHQQTEKKIEEVTSIVRSWTTCDFCKEEIKVDSYQVLDGEISLTTGESYPGSGNTTQLRVDFCGFCFENTILPWLKSKDIIPEQKDSNW